ncbi:YceD family protein [Homoserinimonas aerilata]|nr:YceD family protein [Homoserinimonas aerilata]
MREQQLELVADERLGNAVIGIEPGAPIDIDLRLEALHDGILVTATVESTASGECVRCLIDVAEPVEVEIQEVFAYSEDEAFEYQVQDDHVNLEPVIRDAVVLSLPFQPVCQEDCLGLCPQCGVRLLDNPGHEHEEPTDPRWAKLAGLEGLTEATTTDVIGEEPDGDADREKR